MLLQRYLPSTDDKRHLSSLRPPAPEFDPTIYRNEHRDRVQAMLDQKAKGQEITPAPRVAPRGQVVDLMEALKTSLATAKPRTKTGERAARKRSVER